MSSGSGSMGAAFDRGLQDWIDENIWYILSLIGLFGLLYLWRTYVQPELARALEQTGNGLSGQIYGVELHTIFAALLSTAVAVAVAWLTRPHNPRKEKSAVQVGV